MNVQKGTHVASMDSVKIWKAPSIVPVELDIFLKMGSAKVGKYCITLPNPDVNFSPILLILVS